MYPFLGSLRSLKTKCGLSVSSIGSGLKPGTHLEDFSLGASFIVSS